MLDGLFRPYDLDQALGAGWKQSVSAHWWAVGIVLLAAAVRLPGLGSRSLWFDEALSGCIARPDTLSVLLNVAGSSHPHGYYSLLHLWRAFGASELVLRFPSALCSGLAMALTLGLAQFPLQIYYALEARAYGLAIALSAGMIWLFLRGVRRHGHGPWRLYVHYFIALVVLASDI